MASRKRQPLDVSSRSADLGDNHVARLSFSVTDDATLDLIGHMRNHLNGFAQVIPSTFLGQNSLIHLAAGHIIGTSQNTARKSLVMTEVQVGFGTVA